MVDLKADILSQADCLFCQYGIKSITMDIISRHLGISKKTLYQFFRDKNELVESQVSAMLQRQRAVLDKRSESLGNAIEEVRAAVTDMQGLLSKINHSLFYDLERYYPGAWQVFRDFLEVYLFDRIKANMRRGIAEGIYRKDLDIELLAKMRVQQIYMGLNEKVFPPETYRLPEVMRVVSEHFLYGICSEKGYQLMSRSRETYHED